MKIAILGHKRMPSRTGGVEIVVNELAVRLARLGHEVFVYNRNCGEEKTDDMENIHFIEIPTFKNRKLNAFVYSLLATMHIAFKKYDVVHFHAEGSCVMMPIAKFFGKKLVATIHGLDWQRSKWDSFASKYILLGEKNAVRYADEIITLAPSTRDYFLREYGRETVVIPNGVERTSCVEAKIIKEYGLEKRSYILFLARLTPEKGLDRLIDAFGQLDTDKRLVIAGALEPTTPYIEEIKKKTAEDDRIKLVGFVQGEELAELFSNCFLYVLPSDIEGMPISLLEAVSFRARVLVSSIPENTSVLCGYGNVFEKGNTRSLFEKLKYILENEKLYDRDFKKDNSAQETEEKIDALIEMYDWDEITTKTLEVYEKAIKGTAGSSIADNGG